METKRERPVELGEFQSRNNLPNMVAVYVMVKIKVRRIPELDSNFVGFRAYWGEEIKRVLAIIGEVKVVQLIT